jgi:urease accessory protein
VSLAGQLEITCAADARGRSYLSRQSFCAPFHLSKPYWDEHALIVQIANPTAGVFAGDTLASRVEVETGARLLLTTPSANRIHAMPSGRATVSQSFSVANGAWLEVMPELFIPQANCRYGQRTAIDVASDGEMFFVETLAPGRVARGETFQFAEVDWEFELRFAGRLIARERFILRPSDASTASLRQQFPSAYYASCYLITERIAADDAVWKSVNDLSSSDVLAGGSRLVAGGSSIKILAADSLALSRTLKAVRTLLSPFVQPLLASPRKL